MSRHPEVKWAQRTDKLYITILLPDSKNANVKLDPEGKLVFSANAGPTDALYELNLDLHDKVNVEASKINVGLRNIVCVVEKAEKGWWKRLLKGEGKPPQFLKVDWDKWVDEDEEDEKPEFDFGGMDFSNMGGVGEEPESDDEDEVVPKENSSQDNVGAESEKSEMGIKDSDNQDKAEQHD
eukprot:TRINITY_DN6554_c0_g1_i1.p1 TRINITY_DN6554_c0_g1~~TRINITY_DN6554_c0_g1_i1.p1  ORF type:complete len:181 (-),score=58.07 TRINITY_DN6554_c0_g1_i1:224-766(-)